MHVCILLIQVMMVVMVHWHESFSRLHCSSCLMSLWWRLSTPRGAWRGKTWLAGLLWGWIVQGRKNSSTGTKWGTLEGNKCVVGISSSSLRYQVGCCLVFRSFGIRKLFDQGDIVRLFWRYFSATVLCGARGRELNAPLWDLASLPWVVVWPLCVCVSEFWLCEIVVKACTPPWCSFAPLWISPSVQGVSLASVSVVFGIFVRF